MFGSALVLNRVLRRGAASLRQLVLSAAIVVTLAGGVVMVATPHWTVAIPYIEPASEPEPESQYGAQREPTPDPFGGARSTLRASAEAVPEMAPGGPPLTPPVEPRAPGAGDLPPVNAILPALWLAGAELVLTRLTAALWRLRRSRVTSHPVQDDGLRRFIQRASAVALQPNASASFQLDLINVR